MTLHDIKEFRQKLEQFTPGVQWPAGQALTSELLLLSDLANAKFEEAYKKQHNSD